MSIQTADRFAWQGRYDQPMATAWERDGYLVLDDFVSPEDVARMRARTDSLIKDFDIEAHRVVFSAKGQSHAASDYFMKSAANISFFLEEEAVDEGEALVCQAVAHVDCEHVRLGGCGVPAQGSEVPLPLDPEADVATRVDIE